jgi:Cu2+-exporting ATPase
VSTHPIARAFALADNPVSASRQQVAVGQGVAGLIDGREWRLGRADYAGAQSERPGIYLGVDGHPVARFEVSDQLREDAATTVQRLATQGLSAGLVSGDAEPAVRATAAELGIDDYHAGCSPEQKLDIIRSIQERGESVVMVGDGINDAPVLAGADTSIALAHGAELAQTSADVLLVGESLAPVATAVQVARGTLRVVRQNLAWAIGYNSLALPLAALGYVPPWAAAIGMSASSLIVVLNALRINRFGAS